MLVHFIFFHLPGSSLLSSFLFEMVFDCFGAWRPPQPPDVSAVSWANKLTLNLLQTLFSLWLKYVKNWQSINIFRFLLRAAPSHDFVANRQLKHYSFHPVWNVRLCLCREQRVTGVCVFILTGLSVFMSPILKVINQTCFYLVFQSFDLKMNDVTFIKRSQLKAERSSADFLKPGWHDQHRPITFVID